MQDRGPGMKWYGTLFISCLWLLMLSTVIVSATGFLEWLDALYIISYVKIVAVAIQYAPQVGLVIVGRVLIASIYYLRITSFSAFRN